MGKWVKSSKLPGRERERERCPSSLALSLSHQEEISPFSESLLPVGKGREVLNDIQPEVEHAGLFLKYTF